MSNDEHKAEQEDELFVFPAWHNKVPKLVLGFIGPVLTVLVIGLVTYYFSPEFTDVGYRPQQPVAYSHKLHAGDLAIDCQYCHVGVEKGPVAGVPPTQTCMNCHKLIKPESKLLEPVRESFKTGNPIKWVRVHKTPDYAFFDHSAHVNAAIGCETCHGRVDQMVEVTLQKSLSMAWCVDCHKAPEQHLRPKEFVTTMGYVPKMDQADLGKKIKDENNINPPLHCSGCHR